MISKCTTGCPMITPYASAARHPRDAGPSVTTGSPDETHRCQPLTTGRPRTACRAAFAVDADPRSGAVARRWRKACVVAYRDDLRCRAYCGSTILAARARVPDPGWLR